MLDMGDYLVPRLDQHVNLTKLPLMYWTGAAGQTLQRTRLGCASRAAYMRHASAALPIVIEMFQGMDN